MTRLHLHFDLVKVALRGEKVGGPWWQDSALATRERFHRCIGLADELGNNYTLKFNAHTPTTNTFTDADSR